MALWKKTSSGQGDPPGPLGKYITMYNKAVKTLGTDNPEVLKNFFASQQYGQNNTQIQQNNNINKAPQQKESKVGNVAGDVGTLALSTLQNFGMNIPGDIIKTVAPKAAILDVLPQTTTNQYVKQRNQSLGQNIKDVADAANTVAAFEVGAPLVAKGVQAGFKYASPYVKPVVNSVKNRLFKSEINWAKWNKEVPKSITDNTKLSINADGINKNRTWKKGYKEIDGHEDIVPVVNDGEYTPVQDIFIEEHNKYMNSPLFEQKMKEFYPEVNIEQYKKAINHNLEREKLTYKSASEYSSENKNVVGWYVPRENMPNGSFIMPDAKISFKQRINLANEEISKPAYNYQENAGKSFSTSLGKTIEHELGHQRTNANWLLPDDLTQDYLIQNVKKDLTVDELTSGSRNLTNYYSDPTEFDTRILNLKNSLRENGIVDFHKEPITKEHIDKLFSYKSNEEANELQKLVSNNEKYKKGFDLTTEEGRALKKEHDEIWDKIHMLNKKENPYSTSSDIHNLKYYWNSDFLAKMANKLPSLSGISATGIGLSSIKWKNK